MGDSSGNVTGLVKRATELLNNKTFSDVQIQVKDGNNQKTFPAHKLFLAMGSQEFANMFYNNVESPNYVKIFDYKPQTVYSMLQYLYTDSVDFTSIEQAREVYSLAKKFDIKDLLVECSIHLSKEETTLENLFDKYEFALTENLPDALKVCRNLVSSQTMTVLKSPQFIQAPMPVVEDILKLDYLSVVSEVELIYAAIKWAQEECYRRGSVTENLRICLYPLFKYLRFLALSAADFCDLVERHENILNSHESTVLTMSILQPGTSNRIPSGFCSNSCPRKFPTDAIIATENHLIKPNNSVDKNASLSRENINLDGKFEKPIARTEKFDMEEKIKQCLQDPFGHVKTVESKKKLESGNLIEFSQGNRDILKSQEPISNINWGVKSSEKTVNENNYEWSNTSGDVDYINLNINKPLGTQTVYPSLNIETAIKPPMPSYNFSSHKRSESTPAYSRKQSPMVKVSPHVSMSQRRTFDFPLYELERCITSAMRRDIKCSATISLSKGAIEIYGVELKIQQMSNSDEVIESFLTLSGSSYPSTSKSYEEKLRNSVYPIYFPEAIKLFQNNHIKIEVLIEELVLNRCSGYRADQCELNNGLNVTAKIKMQSNQFSDESRDYFYLISRLIYKPYS